ncbi:NAD-dependent epimerase [Pseudalgibacter alginicilyticus]|uniref:NAD-dependent epimerase n=1 Tax=Pseudalgibacter alginicilyticus TaxID=1736674 RepID=A0A0P0CZ25_9FLAO|nr:NAD-dependent epimerase/dehydratase family protein [Pseudalgibacter alginicilyticus]ALJ05871.1 NAD-dependent epimerase [Pseudalgibacter alginicilyticus]
MILVTGSTGLVGSHLLYKLVSNNESVKAIYRNKNKLNNVKNVFSTYTKNVEPLFNAIEWIEADILDIPSLAEAFKGVTHVYHCAAFVSFEPNKYNLLRKTNIEGTSNIVNLCLSHSVKKLCYVSSVATLGDPPKNMPTTENSSWNPETDNNVYAITKYGAEMEVWRASQEGLPVVIVKPGVILGAGIWQKGTGSLFTKAYKGLKYYSIGSIGLVDVEDVASAMIQLLKSNIENDAFILVAENLPYKQFLQSLATSVGAKPPSKIAKPWLLNLAWKLDWLKHKLTGKRRLLTKHLAKSITTTSNYSNKKIKMTLNFEFKPISKTITEVGSHFQKQVQ